MGPIVLVATTGVSVSDVRRKSKRLMNNTNSSKFGMYTETRPPKRPKNPTGPTHAEKLVNSNSPIPTLPPGSKDLKGTKTQHRFDSGRIPPVWYKKLPAAALIWQIPTNEVSKPYFNADNFGILWKWKTGLSYQLPDIREYGFDSYILEEPTETDYFSYRWKIGLLTPPMGDKGKWKVPLLDDYQFNVVNGIDGKKKAIGYVRSNPDKMITVKSHIDGVSDLRYFWTTGVSIRSTTKT